MSASGVESRTVALETGDGRGGRIETDVAYHVAGEGPPVVLLHGIGLDSATVSWRDVVPALATSHRVYAPDLPAHGGSDAPRARYTHEFFLDVIESFLATVGVREPALVGASMGSCVGLAYALAHDVDRLVLVDSYGLGEDAPWRPAAGALLRVPGAASVWWSTIGATRRSVRTHLRRLTDGTPRPAHVDDVYDATQRASGGRAMASWQRSEFGPAGLRTCLRPRLSELDAPALFVHGAADPLIPVSWSRRAAAALDAELAVFDGCGHCPTREVPERFNRIVGSFL